MYFKVVPQRDIRVKDSAIFSARHKISQVATLVGLLRTNVYGIKKLMSNGEDVNRRACSGRKTVVDREIIPFEADPGRPCDNMQTDVRLNDCSKQTQDVHVPTCRDVGLNERRLCDELLLSF